MPYSVLVENAETPMSDGVILRSTVYRPAVEAETFPVLLTRTPYGRDLAVNSAYFNPTTVAAQGYVVVMQDCRGRFGSDGEFLPSVNENYDGAASVEWAARLPYSNGKVGMWGRSYFSETQWRAAQESPTGLQALALGVSAGGNANNGALYRGGAHELGSRLGWGHASASLNQLFREFTEDPEGRQAALDSWMELDGRFADGSVYDVLPLRDLESSFGSFMNSQVLPSAGEGPGSAFTQLWDSASASPVALPTLHIGGWFDIFTPNTLSQYRQQLALSSTVPGITPRLIVGPWTHTNFSGGFPDVSFGIGASGGLVGGLGDLSSLHVAWFDAALKNDASRLDTVPPVLLYFMGENAWRGFDALPSPTSSRNWYLGSAGTLSFEPGKAGIAEYSYDPLDPVPAAGGATMIHGAFPAGPADQAAVEARSDVLTFTTAPFEQPLTVFGDVSATIYASSSAVDTDFVVRMCRVAPDGTSTSIADGIVRASWRESYAGSGSYVSGIEPSPIVPGEVYEYTISLWETAFTFAEGESLRVQITSSCHPRWDRNLNTGKLAYESLETVVAEQTIHFGPDFPSRLTVGVLN